MDRLERYRTSATTSPSFPVAPTKRSWSGRTAFFYRTIGQTIWIAGVWHGAQIPAEPWLKPRPPARVSGLMCSGAGCRSGSGPALTRQRRCAGCVQTIGHHGDSAPSSTQVLCLAFTACSSSSSTRIFMRGLSGAGITFCRTAPCRSDSPSRICRMTFRVRSPVASRSICANTSKMLISARPSAESSRIASRIATSSFLPTCNRVHTARRNARLNDSGDRTSAPPAHPHQLQHIERLLQARPLVLASRHHVFADTHSLIP